MKKIKFIAIVCFVFLLSSCGEGTIKVFAFFSDLINIASKKFDIVYINASVSIQGLEKEEDINFLRDNLNSFTNERITGEYTKSLSFDIKIPIINENYLQSYMSENNSEKDFLHIVGSSSEGMYQFYYNFNRSLVERINQYVYQKHYQRIDLNNFDMILSIENDMTVQMILMAFSVYVNDIAYPFEYTNILQRRDKIELRISEVLRRSVAENNNLNYIFYLYE
jgi:hypothetical protein